MECRYPVESLPTPPQPPQLASSHPACASKQTSRQWSGITRVAREGIIAVVVSASSTVSTWTCLRTMHRLTACYASATNDSLRAVNDSSASACQSRSHDRPQHRRKCLPDKSRCRPRWRGRSVNRPADVLNNSRSCARGEVPPTVVVVRSSRNR